MSNIQIIFGTKDTAVDRTDAVGIVPARDHQGLFAGFAKAPAYILFLNQIHSAAVVDLQDMNGPLILDADAAVTSLSNIALAVKTADCAPIMLWDETANVIAAVHSGWQGTLKNIIAPTIAAMVLKGADTSRIKAQIGPCLQKHNLKIGREAPEIYDMFKQTVGHTEFLTDHPHEEGKILFDNAGMIIAQLRETGITAIEADETCTLDSADDYYSYRYRQHDAAHEHMRNVSLIWRDA